MRQGTLMRQAPEALSECLGKILVSNAPGTPSVGLSVEAEGKKKGKGQF